jgi:DNA repair protein RecO (recombination protein O)
MAILKTEAVVMRGWKMGETSKILALYTRDYGQIKVVAKGGRGPKSKFKGCLEPLSRIGIVYYDKRTRDLQLLSQADLIDPYLRIIGDIKRTTLSLTIAELIYRAVSGEEPFPQIYDLLTSVLARIDRANGFLEACLWFFESRFIELMGYKPTWDNCLECHASLGTDGGYFQPESGGLLCNRCGAVKGGLIVSGETLEILYWLQQSDIGDVDRLDPGNLQKVEIRKMFDLYFRTHIEHMRGLKSLSLYYDFEKGMS